MKRMLSVLLGGLLLAGALAAAPAPDNRIVNGVMVIVNNEVVTRKDVMQYIGDTVNLLIERYRSQPDTLNQRLEEVLREGVEHLVENKLILHEFETAGYNLPESLIEDQVKERIRERFGGDRVSLTKSLREQGMTVESFRRRIREDFIIGAMSSTKISKNKILISPHKIEKYYTENLEQFKVGDEYKIRTIMLNRGPRSTPGSVRKLADEIVAKLNDGASFAELASIHSEDSYRAKGGDRGWVELDKEHYKKPLEEAIKALKPGQRSAAIEADETVWVVQVDEIKPSRYRTLADVRSEIEKALSDQEASRLRQQWIQRLKEKSFVKYF